MKNDLTAEEWVVLNEYIQFGAWIFSEWEFDEKKRANKKLLQSAKSKFDRVAKEIKQGV